MTTRIRIICALCLAIAIAIGITAAIIRNNPPDFTLGIPAQLSVYLPDENTILLMSFDEFLTGCIRGMLPDGEEPPNESINVVTAALKTQLMYHLQQRSDDASEPFSADFTINEIFPYTPDNGDLALNEKLRTAAQCVQPLRINGSLFDCKICKISSGLTDACLHCPSTLLLCDVGTEQSISRYAFTAEEVWQTMGISYAPSDCGKWFANAVYENTSSLKSIEFCSREISGRQLQKLFDLPSDAITVEYTDDNFYFSCKGFGENMGLSVNAAVFLAKSGYSEKEITAFFYPEAEYKDDYLE